MVALIAALTLGTFPAEVVSAAQQDWHAQAAQGYDCRYLLSSPEQVPVCKFVAVLASREPLLDHSTPVAIGGGLVRLNLTALRWSAADWGKLFAHPANPYTSNLHDTLIVPAGFFIDRVSDQTRSDAYFRLLFGGDKQPKTLSEFLLAAGGIDRKKQRGLEQLHVVAESNVNVARNSARIVELTDATFATAFTTYDTKQPVPGADPLEQLDRNFKFDGAECFVLVPKVHTSGVRGVFPVTALANGQEAIVFEAPVDLVLDDHQTGGFTSIRNPISCVGCHAASQSVNTNALRQRLAAGVELLTYDRKRQVELELKHLASMDKALADWDAGYEAALFVVNGLSAAANSFAFASAVKDYRADVDLERAAGELFSTAEELRLALGYASAQRILIDNRLAGLSSNIPCPRPSFEANYLKAVEVLKLWRAANASH